MFLTEDCAELSANEYKLNSQTTEIGLELACSRLPDSREREKNACVSEYSSNCQVISVETREDPLRYDFYLSHDKLPKVKEENDLGVVINNKYINMALQCAHSPAKAYTVG